MEKENTKSNRQLEGCYKFRTARGIGTYVYPTGFGKSRLALLIIEKVLIKDSNAIIVLIVHSEKKKQEWTKTISEWKSLEPSIGQIKVYTISYLQVNNLFPECKLLIVDEIQEFYSFERKNLLFKIKHTFRLCMTATPYDKGRETDVLRWCPIIDVIEKSEAIKKGWISQYIEYNLAVKLNERDEAIMKQYNEQITNFGSKFGKNDLKIASTILQGDYKNGIKPFQYATKYAESMGWSTSCSKEIDDIWNPSKVMGYAKNFMDFVSKRKTFLYNNSTKLVATLEILSTFIDKKIICFGQSTEFADKLKDLHNQANEVSLLDLGKAVSYHSKLKPEIHAGKTGKMIKFGVTRLKKRNIEQFEQGVARIITTATALDVGYDSPTINMAITVSGTSNPIQREQRNGRTARLNIYNPDEVVIIVNLYLQNTKDEQWLRERQNKSSNRSFIKWINNINEIV